ncbi:MAG: hypothetical protein Q8R28_15900, partial [Dehalococcoidia bacterium]|nr:hypothetical protein [Dehalococcoidia bacterium]
GLPVPAGYDKLQGKTCPSRADGNPAGLGGPRLPVPAGNDKVQGKTCPSRVDGNPAGPVGLDCRSRPTMTGCEARPVLPVQTGIQRGCRWAWIAGPGRQWQVAGQDLSFPCRRESSGAGGLPPRDDPTPVLSALAMVTLPEASITT